MYLPTYSRPNVNGHRQLCTTLGHVLWPSVVHNHKGIRGQLILNKLPLMCSLFYICIIDIRFIHNDNNYAVVVIGGKT